MPELFSIFIAHLDLVTVVEDPVIFVDLQGMEDETVFEIFPPADHGLPVYSHRPLP